MGLVTHSLRNHKNDYSSKNSVYPVSSLSYLDIKPTERQIRNKLRDENAGIRGNNWISDSQWTRMNSK